MRPFTILINGISISEGGSEQVLIHLARELATLGDHQIHLISDSSHTLPDLPVTIHLLPWLPDSGYSVFNFYARTLPRLARRVQADVLFSMTNILPFSSPCPTALLVQNAGYFSSAYQESLHKSFPGWRNRLIWWFKSELVKLSIRQADVVTVQTRSLADQISRDCHLPDKRKPVVIPHGPGSCSTDEPHALPSGKVKMGYVSKFGVQKNFDTLLNAMPLILQHRPDTELHLTLDTGHEPNRAILNPDRERWSLYFSSEPWTCAPGIHLGSV